MMNMGWNENEKKLSGEWENEKKKRIIIINRDTLILFSREMKKRRQPENKGGRRESERKRKKKRREKRPYLCAHYNKWIDKNWRLRGWHKAKRSKGGTPCKKNSRNEKSDKKAREKKIEEWIEKHKRKQNDVRLMENGNEKNWRR